MAAARKRTVWERVAFYSELGLLIPAAVMIGYLVGYGIDRWLRTTPIFAVIFLLLGFAAGFLALYRMIVSYERDGDTPGK